MTNKKVVGGFELYQREGQGYTVGMKKDMDMSTRIIFIEMLAEITARELGLTLEQFTKNILVDAKTAPMKFDEK